MCSGYVVGESHTAAMEDGAEDHETLGPVIDIGISVVQLHHRFLDPNRHPEWFSDGPRTGPAGNRRRARWRVSEELTTGPEERGREEEERLRQDKKSPRVRRKSASPRRKL
jgi:hypothetical protein